MTDDTRPRTLARAAWLDELAGRVRAEGDHAQADELTRTAAEMREAALVGVDVDDLPQL